MEAGRGHNSDRKSIKYGVNKKLMSRKGKGIATLGAKEGKLTFGKGQTGIAESVKGREVALAAFHNDANGS